MGHVFQETQYNIFLFVQLFCSEEIKERYGDSTKLTHKMSGSFYEIFSRVMKVFVGKKVTIPGSFKRLVYIRM